VRLEEMSEKNRYGKKIGASEKNLQVSLKEKSEKKVIVTL
jgi:hypothetical protein